MSRHMIQACSLLACFLLTPIVGAQEDELRMTKSGGGLDVEFQAGFGDFVDRHAATSVSFLMRNNSGQQITGSMRLVNPDTKARIELREITLSPQAGLRVSTIQDLSEWTECFAELTDPQGEIIWRQAVDLTAGQGVDTNVHYCLLIHDSARAINFPQLEVPANLNTAHQAAAAESGRHVAMLQTRTWQIPDHPAPMRIAVAALIPKGTRAGDIKAMKSLAEWVCEGGHLYFRTDADKVRDAIIKHLPLTPEPEFQDGAFSVQRVGRGQLVRYEGTIVDSADSPEHRRILTRISQTPVNRAGSLPKKIREEEIENGSAELNRIYLLSFIGLYGLFGGFFMLMLFRLKRRKVMIYAVTVVVVATIGAGVLGSMLRLSRGDLRWRSITWGGAGGMTQMAHIDLLSSGARSTQLTVSGIRPDVQVIGPDNSRDYYYYGYEPASDLPQPFELQLNRLKEKDRFQVGVPLTPWGTNQAIATDFIPMNQTVNFQVRLLSDLSTVEVRVDNQLPFLLSNARIMVGTTTPPGVNSSNVADEYGYYDSQQFTTSADGAEERYFTLPLQPIASKAQIATSADLTWQSPTSEDYHRMQVGIRNFVPPRVSRTREVTAWLIATINESPGLRIVPEDSDFYELQESHIYIQEIRPEDINAQAFRQAMSPRGVRPQD